MCTATAMGASGYVLILLVLVLSLCGGTEYYVRPTEPTNTSCPDQPCLTLSQYTSDSDHYFKSNTVFKFLPGTHHMDRPITIGNVHNMSLEGLSDESGEYPHLVAQFSCETEAHECMNTQCYALASLDSTLKLGCAAVLSHSVYNVSMNAIRITVLASSKPMSAVILKYVSDISLQLNVTCPLYNKTKTFFHILTMSKGIEIHDATSVDIHSSSVSNCQFGLRLHNTTNTHITKVTAMYSEFTGVALNTATETHISSTITAHNEYGIQLSSMNNTYITNVTTAHNHRHGMHLSNINNTHITNLTTAHNHGHGMEMKTMSNTFLTDLIAAHNAFHGVVLYSANNTYILNMTTAHNGHAHSGFDGMDLSHMNNTHITSIAASYNYGVGIFLSTMNNTTITKTTATHNGKRLRIGIFNGQIIMASSTTTLIYSTSFTNISTQSVSSTEEPNSLPAIIVLYHSTLAISGCDFKENNISAVGAYASNITVSGNLTFSNNRAFAGTAFVLTSDSILTSTENSHVYFLNNHAINTGGVFHITSNSVNLVSDFSTYYTTSTCFLNTEGSRSQLRFTYANNSAGKGGDILYGGHVALSLDGDWNCLESFKNTSNILQHGLSLISSDPSRVCFCNGSGEPDCLVLADPTPRTVYPGQTISISAVVVGQDFGTVAGSVYAHFLQGGILPQLESGQEVQAVTHYDCSHHNYTIFSHSDVTKAVLVLTAHDSYVSNFLIKEVDDYTLSYNTKYYHSHAVEALVYSNNPIYVNVSVLPCPSGFMLTTNSSKCDCDLLFQQIHGIQCHIQEQTIGRSGLIWVGLKQDDNETNGTVATSEYCPLNYCTGEESNVTLSEPDSQCNYNHSGTLCGGCQPGLSLALGSAQCLQCSNKHLALLIPLTLAGPVLVLFIKLLDLTISQGTLNGLIFYANIVKANEYIFLPRGQTNPLTVFIAWLNLDLGVETCLYQGLTAYSKTWLQFVFPFYIWSIAGLIIILARYSDRVAKVMGNNSVPVLATLFVLSYAKLLRTIITALSYTIVYTSHGPKAVWTADGNVDYLGPKHAPLFATVMAVLLFLWLPYTLLLFLGQWLHGCNCQLIIRMLVKLKPFLDAHYGPLKSKHRYWFGALLFVRAAILLISALVPANRSSTVVLCISVIAAVLTHFGHLVYCNLAVAMFDITFFMNLALLTGAYSFTTTAGGGLAVSAYILIGIAFAQFVGLVVFKVFSILKWNEKVMACLCRKQTVVDDWELYEEAVRLREIESDSEEQENDDSGSNESLPTY